jgi:hypothetical protein
MRDRGEDKLAEVTDIYPLGDEDPYFHFTATLRIFGEIADLDEISAKLGLRPTNTHRRGERKGPRSPVYKHDMWAYSAPVAEDRPLDVHIQILWSHIKANKTYILQLKDRCTVDVFCGYRSSSRTAGFEVSAKSLEMFIELNIPFGVSVIIM